MFKTKNAYVREVIARAINSRLPDEKANSAAYHMVKAMIEKPYAFGDFGSVQEPLNITSAFNWAETAPFNPEFWGEVNQSLVDLYVEAENDQWAGESCDCSDCEIYEYDCEEDCEDQEENEQLFFPEALQCIFGSHAVDPTQTLPKSFKGEDITLIDVAGEHITGWGLVSKENNTTLPFFCETRKLARLLKDEDEKVTKVLLVALTDK